VTLDVRGRGAEPVRIDLLPRLPGERHYLATERYGIRYHGSARLSLAQEHALAAFADAVRSGESAWPAVLSLEGAGTAAGGSGAATFFTVERAASASGDAVWTELLVRVTARCNQACPFCSGPPAHPDADPERLRSWLESEIPRHPGPTVTLTGGEPTLWPGLAEMVRRLAGRHDVVETKVQTNAVSFANAARVAEYPPSPRLTFFVSFHAATPDLYDRCTGTTGQFDRAVEGIRNLLAAGHGLTLNVVANRHNVDHLAAWPAAVHALFGAPPRLRLHFSITMCPEHRPRAPDWLVQYGVLSPRLQAAVRTARALGLTCDPLLASSHAAIPSCLLPEQDRARGARGDGRDAVPLQRRDETGIGDAMTPWVKAPSCARCSQDRYCLGLPRAYVERFGIGELTPIP
jgi:hypothetical protein